MSVVLTGAARVVLDPAEKTVDPLPFVKVRKSRKYMGTQDDLAVVAVGRALAQAKHAAPPGRVGLFAAIGFIPFERSDIAPVLASSLTDGRFDVRRFNKEGYVRAHPLLTFRCLPNMPAFHVSMNFGIEGPYFVTYPGAGQAYLALDEAKRALESGAVDVAIAFATCHQRNFLVEHHHARLDVPVAAEDLRDASCALVLESAAHANARGAAILATLDDVTVSYEPFDPLGGAMQGPPHAGVDFGAAAPFLAIVDRLENKPFACSVRARDGISAESRWS